MGYGSKMLKSFVDSNHLEDGLLFWLKEHTIWKIRSICKRYTERICRSIAFARIGWLNYDFDANTVWQLLEFKLKRIYPVLLNGNAIQEKEDMDALLEAIALCKRLKEENYDEKYYTAHDEKWGPIQSKTDRVARRDQKGRPIAFHWDVYRVNANTPELEHQERAEFVSIFMKSHSDFVADVDRLNEIFKKHLNTWWD